MRGAGGEAMWTSSWEWGSGNNFFFFKINTAFNILIKCQVAPGGLVKAEESSAEGNGDVTHFVCLVYAS